ncbi:MAG: tetratricopeptide repeat protein [Candidatus Eisenbacteria bacterium]
MAVSHHSMGLVDEALEEVDVALACDQLPAEVERRARELRGSCLMELQRFREAVHEYREAAERAGDDKPARRAALYNLGRALEAVEEWQEASETYTRLKVEAPGLLDVEKRLRHCESQLTKSNASGTGKNRNDDSAGAEEAA